MPGGNHDAINIGPARRFQPGRISRSGLKWLGLVLVLGMIASACQVAPVQPEVVDPTIKSIGTVADPFVITAPVGFGIMKEFLFTTTSLGLNVPRLERNALNGWTNPVDALPNLPGWAQPATVWAPEVIFLPSNPGPTKFVLYFSANHWSYGVHCVGVATAPNVQGPYTPASNPIVCQTDCGSIDPNPFVAPGGALHLAWKWDGQACDPNTNNPSVINRLHAQPLAANGQSVTGTSAVIMEANPATWEGHNIEAPGMHVRNGLLHLFYAGGQHWNGSYAEGHAVCNGPLGPCVPSGPDPLISTNWQFCGPGHGSPFVTKHGLSKFVFHGYESCSNGQPTAGAGRKLWEAHLCWDGNQPTAQSGGQGCLP